jgi:hypothetical protein
VMADDVKAPWQLAKNDADGKPIEREPEAGDYLSALSMLLGLVAFWAKVGVCMCVNNLPCVCVTVPPS